MSLSGLQCWQSGNVWFTWLTTLWINPIQIKCFHDVVTWKAHIPRCWALSMRHCTAAAWCLSLFSVLLLSLSPPSPQWKRLGAKMTERLLLSILFSAHLKERSSTHTQWAIHTHTLYMCSNTKEPFETPHRNIARPRTAGRRSVGNWRSNAVRLNSCRAARRTAGPWPRSSPLPRAAPGPSGKHCASLRSEPAREAHGKTASEVQPRPAGERWTDSPRPGPVWPTGSKQYVKYRHQWESLSEPKRRSLTRRLLTRTTEPDFLKRPSVSKWSMRPVQTSAMKLTEIETR